LTKGRVRGEKNVGNSGRSSGDAGEGDAKDIMDIYKEQKRCVMPLKTNLQIKELVV
jgi:hypothetical protein